MRQRGRERRGNKEGRAGERSTEGRVRQIVGRGGGKRVGGGGGFKHKDMLSRVTEQQKGVGTSWMIEERQKTCKEVTNISTRSSAKLREVSDYEPVCGSINTLWSTCGNMLVFNT